MDTQTFLTYTCRSISECNTYYIYTTGNSGDDLTVAYTDCEGNFKTDTVIAPGGTVNYTLEMRVCASEILDPGRGIVTQEGVCTPLAENTPSGPIPEVDLYFTPQVKYKIYSTNAYGTNGINQSTRTFYTYGVTSTTQAFNIEKPLLAGGSLHALPQNNPLNIPTQDIRNVGAIWSIGALVNAFQLNSVGADSTIPDSFEIQAYYIDVYVYNPSGGFIKGDRLYPNTKVFHTLNSSGQLTGTYSQPYEYLRLKKQDSQYVTSFPEIIPLNNATTLSTFLTPVGSFNFSRELPGYKLKLEFTIKGRLRKEGKTSDSITYKSHTECIFSDTQVDTGKLHRNKDHHFKSVPGRTSDYILIYNTVQTVNTELQVYGGGGSLLFETNNGTMEYIPLMDMRSFLIGGYYIACSNQGRDYQQTFAVSYATRGSNYNTHQLVSDTPVIVQNPPYNVDTSLVEVVTPMPPLPPTLPDYLQIGLVHSTDYTDICSLQAPEDVFYIDTDTWNYASIIYADMYGNNVAPIGYYSEGIEGYRYWNGSTLGPQISCPTGGSGGCFISGTEITLSDNTVKVIEDLQIGDQLASYNIEGLPLYSDDQNVLSTWNTSNIQGDYTTATVVNIEPFSTDKIININGLLQTTPNHRHLVKVGDIWSFIEAKDIKVGDILRNYNNEEVVVETVSEEVGDFTAYTLDVEDVDLFYGNGILTHNIKEETLPQDF